MSGGSWGYLYRHIEEAADLLENEKCALRRAFGKHMQKVAYAMKAIEWVDSSDWSEPEDTDAIKAVFGDLSTDKEREILVEDAKELVEKLNNLIKER